MRSDSGSVDYTPGTTCPECGALVGHWRPCPNASPELQERWSAARKRRLMEWRTIPVLPLYLLGALLWALGVCILSITDRLIGRDIGSQLWD